MSDSPILFVVPALMIVGGWWRGTRPEERRLALGTALITGLGAIAAVLIADQTQAELAKGSAYALVVVATSSFAMLIRRRPGDDWLHGGDVALDPPPDWDDDRPPFDWDRFERDFWGEVERHRRKRVPA
ncbi:MAG: hypothetical protein AABM29_02365 [Actinomycetota bacterium]